MNAWSAAARTAPARAPHVALPSSPKPTSPTLHFALPTELDEASRIIHAIDVEGDHKLGPIAISPSQKALVVPGLALGARPTPPLVNSEQSSRTWYGGQLLGADVAALALAALGSLTEIKPPYLAGGAAFIVTAPLLHHSHGNSGRALGSLVLRLMAGGLFHAGLEACGTSSVDGVEPLCTLSFLGILSIPAVIVIDSTVLAYRTEPAAKPTRDVHVSPWVNRDGNAAGVTWAGRF